MAPNATAAERSRFIFQVCSRSTVRASRRREACGRVQLQGLLGFSPGSVSLLDLSSGLAVVMHGHHPAAGEHLAAKGKRLL